MNLQKFNDGNQNLVLDIEKISMILKFKPSESEPGPYNYSIWFTADPNYHYVIGENHDGNTLNAAMPVSDAIAREIIDAVNNLSDRFIIRLKNPSQDDIENEYKVIYTDKVVHIEKKLMNSVELYVVTAYGDPDIDYVETVSVEAIDISDKLK